MTTSAIQNSNDKAHPNELHWGDFVGKQAILQMPRVSSVKKLLQQMAELLDDGQNDELDSDDILSRLLERERLGSTALGEGIALPHARVEGLEQPHVAIIALEEGIDMGAGDSRDVDLAIGLAVPQKCNDLHLTLLASISRDLSNSHFAALLRNASDAEEVKAHIENRNV